MRHASGHGGSAVFLGAEFIAVLTEDRNPAIDIYEACASAIKGGVQMEVPSFDLSGPAPSGARQSP